MGYDSRQKYYVKCYTPSDDIVSNDATVDSGAYADYTLVKTIELVAPIIGASLFRFKFDLAHDTNSPRAYGRITITNGGVTTTGTEQTCDTIAYATKTEDIAATNWLVGDTIQLFIHSQNAVAVSYVKNFQICGIGNEFMNV